MIKFLSLLLVPFSMLLGNWPQYHGPMFNKSATFLISLNSSSLLEASPSWTAPTPLGFSSFSTAGKSAFTLIAEEDEDGLLRELCVSLDLSTGKRLWQTWLGMASYGHSGGNAGTPNNSGGDGPRSTPSVSEGLVFVYDSSMTLHCLSAQSGKTVWKIDIIREHNGKNITWKNASSPLLVHDLVIVIGGGPGESMIGIERNTGKLRWKNGSETATHATPAYATIHGQDQAIFLCRSGLVSINPLNGRELWKQDFPLQSFKCLIPSGGRRICFLLCRIWSWCRFVQNIKKKSAIQQQANMAQTQRNDGTLEYPLILQRAPLWNFRFQGVRKGSPAVC